jgi:hypothetical protein
MIRSYIRRQLTTWQTSWQLSMQAWDSRSHAAGSSNYNPPFWIVFGIVGRWHWQF